MLWHLIKEIHIVFVVIQPINDSNSVIFNKILNPIEMEGNGYPQINSDIFIGTCNGNSSCIEHSARLFVIITDAGHSHYGGAGAGVCCI